ncbi:MAG: Ferredoxin--NADP reductase [Candidatus Woesearchaeota archaeon]|nr:Ferredoxin--NADP reductase [Candidatus Woesearchaeota archaeon]
MDKSYEVIIVGAGPAGLFAAYQLADRKKVCLIDKGHLVVNRPKTEAMCGIGGSGTFSDGKLHFSPVLSHEKILHLYSEKEYQKYLDKVNKIYTKFGVNAEMYPKNDMAVENLVSQAKRQGIQLHVRKIKHVGSDKLPAVIENFEKYLQDKGVEIKPNTNVIDIIVKSGKCTGVELESGEIIKGSNVILCPGRVGASWVQKIAKKHNISYDYEKIEVGVRVEFPAAIMKKHADLMYEAIFKISTPTFDDKVRTFCPCPKGMVSTEKYDGFVCVNGHSNADTKTQNSNFAFVSEIELTEPQENTTEYGKSIGKVANVIGGEKPIIQRLADLRSGRRSTWGRIRKSYVEPTLKNVTPGDIAMVLPHRIVTNLLEGLEMLDKVMPGIDSGGTLLYAPEIKFRASKIKTGKHLNTEIKNLFVAGDGVGLSGNIVGAAATGLMAAQGILEK